MLPVLDQALGSEGRQALLHTAGIYEIPDGTAMIPEGGAARLHRQLRHARPALAPQLARQAGVNTADYILANRIPRPAQWLLRALPAGPAARVLSSAIAKNAWTFAGSGQFRVITPWVFEITQNPLIRDETSPDCLCHWHAAVFERLYRVLVAKGCSCVETRCGAQGQGQPCRFEVSRR